MLLSIFYDVTLLRLRSGQVEAQKPLGLGQSFSNSGAVRCRTGVFTVCYCVFTSQTLSEFWLSVERQYPLLGQKAMGILIPFATSYLCETGFSAVAALKTKYRSQLNIEQELRVAVKVVHCKTCSL